MLAVVFGCTRFHTYIYGKRCTIQSDHKPLSMIILKNIVSAPTRLQRMLLRLQSYDIDIEYIPGKCLPLPDTLSRQPLPENNEILFEKQISYTRFSEPRITQIKNKTKKEKEYQELSSMIIKGWPKERRDIPQTIREYWTFRDELTIENSMIIKGNQILIPTHLRPEILKDLHIPQLGIVKTNLLAKTKAPASTEQDKLLDDRQKKASDRYNTKARTNKPALNSGQRVFIRNPINSTWSPGTIHTEHPSPNSYMVNSDHTGSRFRRTLTDLRRDYTARRDDTASRNPPDIAQPDVAYERPSRQRRPPNRLDL